MFNLSGPTPVQVIPPPDDVEVDSPEWWAYELDRELAHRTPLIELYERYYVGQTPLAFATSRYRESFGQMLAAVADNWMPMVIGASVQGLHPQGFLFGDDDESGDKDAWDIWQRSGMDSEAPLAFTEACKHGESYLLVWPEVDPRGTFGRFFSRRSGEVIPRITVEHPGQFVVRRSAGNRMVNAAAWKRWRDDTGEVHATLYLPDSIHYWRQVDNKWVTRRESGENELGYVPAFPLVNEPQMLPARPPTAVLAHGIAPTAHVGLGRSDMADIISTVDQINKLLCDMMVASEYAAFRQRYITGLDIPEDEEDGEMVEQFKAAMDRVWTVPSNENGSEPKFGEFGATDLSNYTGAIEQRVQSLAARTQTPPHYLLGQVTNVSGDALIAAEAGKTAKGKNKQRHFGESIEGAMRCAFAWKGDAKRATAWDAEVNWKPVETRSESQYMDSLTKKLAIGVPHEQLWKDAGYSPQQIRHFKRMAIEYATIFGPPEPPQTDEPDDAREPALAAAD